MKRVHGLGFGTCACDVDQSLTTVRWSKLSMIIFRDGENCGYMNLRRAGRLRIRLGESLNITSPVSYLPPYRGSIEGWAAEREFGGSHVPG
jgi:hypothetical protein